MVHLASENTIQLHYTSQHKMGTSFLSLIPILRLNTLKTNQCPIHNLILSESILFEKLQV